jgi:vancomycin resistance protein YoaR
MAAATEARVERARARYGRALVGLGVLLLLVAIALGLSRGDAEAGTVAPGVSAGGRELGGRTEEQARAELAAVADDLGRREIVLRADRKEIRVVGAEVGATLEVDATLAKIVSAGREGGLSGLLRAIRRSRTEVELAVSVDAALVAELAPSWQSALGVELPFDGAVEIEDGLPVARLPRAGQRIDVDALVQQLTSALASPSSGPVVVPFVTQTPPIPAEDVQRATERATKILAGPITLSYTPSPEEIERAKAENEEAAKRRKESEDRAKFKLPEKKKRMKRKGRRLVPDPPAATPKAETVTVPEPIEVTWSKDELLAAFRARRIDEPAPTFVVELDEADVKKKLAPFVAKLFDAARDARFDIDEQGRVTVVPSRPGTRVDATRLMDALYAAAATADRRGELPVDKEAQPKFTTEAANALGIKGKVSEFTTHHPCCQPRVKNIHRIADMLDGTIVRPGETFSVNAAVGQRTSARGFVMAPSIGDGEMIETPGGGVSQFATTLYNALFDGGYVIKERQAHSFYFNRYPMGIEATLSFPKPDLVFFNDTPAAVLIRCDYGDTFIRVRLFGDNGGRKVERKVTAPFDYTDPKIEYVANPHRDPEKEKVKEGGTHGWSVVTARVVTMPDGTKREEKRTIVYRPRPRVLEVHPCKIPKDEEGWTGEKCPEPEGEGGGASEPAPTN